MRKRFYFYLFIMAVVSVLIHSVYATTTYASSSINTNTILQQSVHTFTSNSWANSKLAFGPNGEIYLALVAKTGNEISIKRWNGNGWVGVTSVTNIAANITYLNGPLDIAVDSNNRIHLAYHLDIGSGVTSTRGVGYGFYNGSSWSFTQIEAISDPRGWKDYKQPRIAVDSTGKAHIVYEYTDANGSRISAVRYATNASGTWDKVGVFSKSGTSDGGLSAGVAIDSHDTIHVSYADGNAFYYTSKAASTANFPAATKLVDTSSTGSYYSPIIVDGSDHLYFTYSDDDGYSYIESNATGTWQREQVYYDTNRITYPIDVYHYGSTTYLLMDSWDSNWTNEYFFAMAKSGGQWIVGSTVNPAVDIAMELDFLVDSEGSYMLVMLDDGLRNVNSLSGTSVAFGLGLLTPQNSTLNPITANFDKHTASVGYADVTTNITQNGNILNDITRGGVSIGASNYMIDSNTNSVTIKKEYLATLGIGEQVLTFDMSAGIDPTLTITVSDSTPQNSILNPITANFDKYTAAMGYEDVTTNITLSGNTLNAITLSGVSIGASNYLVDSNTNTVTIKKEYLATLGTGEQVLTFDMSAGIDPTLTIMVTETAAPTYTIAAIADQTATALIEGYGAGTPETKTISVMNTGTGNLENLSVALSGTNAQDFVITQPATSLNSGVTTTFTIKAKDGLAAGSYTTTVTVSADNLTDETFMVMQVVNSANLNYTLGDVNQDGAINMTDVYLVYQHVNKKITLTETQLLAADVNRDLQVNAADAQLIQSYYLKKISVFPNLSIN